MAGAADREGKCERLLGILGGMGPLATADFYTKLISSTPASSDQEHIPVVILSDPRVPDRAAAYREGREQDVFDALESGVRRLEAAGASAIAIPCNTAHLWLPRLVAVTSLPFLTITDAALAVLKSRFPRGIEVLVLGTPATVSADVHGAALRGAGFRPIAPDAALQAQVDAVIAGVKRGEIGAARARFERLLDSIGGRGRAVLLACTELPVAAGDRLADDPVLVDTTQALVAACVAWARPAVSREHRIRACAQS